MRYAWAYLYRSYIVMDPSTCGACYLESFASLNICTKREYCLCIQIPRTKFFPMSVHHIYLYAVNLLKVSKHSIVHLKNS